MDNLFDIKGHVVVITGGTGVLGREIGAYLARQGAKVVLLGRNEEVGARLADDIVRQGHEAIFLKTDVMDVAQVEKNLDEVLADYGRVDALLNAAGGNMPGATNGKGEDGSSTSEPVHWTNNSSLEVQEAAMRCLGDCTDADFTQTVTGVNFTIVTVDKSKVSGKIVASSEDRGFSIDGSEGLIAMSGNVVVREDQKFRNNLIAVDGTTLANSLSWSTAFRTAIAFDKEGTIHFVLAGLDTDNSIRQLPFCEDQTDHNAVLSDNERDKYYYGANYKNYFLASWEFDMQSVATAHMLMILNGEAKGWRWGLLNDGNSASPGSATAYNARARRTFIGETEDKIVFATETGDGVLMSQGGRVLQVAGCTNATATSRHDGWMNVADTNGGRPTETEYYPSIYVDGVNVSGGASSTCPLCYKIVYNAK